MIYKWKTLDRFLYIGILSLLLYWYNNTRNAFNPYQNTHLNIVVNYNTPLKFNSITTLPYTSNRRITFTITIVWFCKQTQSICVTSIRWRRQQRQKQQGRQITLNWRWFYVATCEFHVFDPVSWRGRRVRIWPIIRNQSLCCLNVSWSLVASLYDFSMCAHTHLHRHTRIHTVTIHITHTTYTRHTHTLFITHVHYLL